MPQKLSDLVPSELSLVRRGAVRRPFLFAKADEPIEVDESIAKALEQPADGEHEYLAKTLGEEAEPERIAQASALYRLAKTLGEETLLDDVAKAADFTADQRREMAANGQAMDDGSYPIPTRDYLQKAIRAVGRGNAPHAEIRAHIVKRARALGATDLLPSDWNVKKEDEMPEGTGAMVPIKKDDGTWDYSALEPDVAEFWKAQHAETEQLRAENQQLAERVEKAEGETAVERDARLERDMVAKAESFERLPVEPDTFGKTLLAISKAETAGHLPEGTLDSVEQVLKAADEAIGQGSLYAELGSSRRVEKTDAETQLDAKAEEIRKSDTSLTKEQALAKAYRENPGLVAQMREA